MHLLRILPALTLFILALTCPHAAAEIKAATVDVNKLIKDYHVAKKEISVLEANRDKYIKQREVLQASLKEIADELTVIIAKLRDKAMPAAERTNLKQKYEENVNRYNALNKDLNESDQGQIKDLTAKIAKVTRTLLDEIQSIIQQYAKKHGYQWIIDTSGRSNTNISPMIYAKDAKDVTEEVLAFLNEDAPKENTNPEPKEEPQKEDSPALPPLPQR